MTTATAHVDRYALNDYVTALLDCHGWNVQSDGDSEALNDAVHVCSDALDALLNAPHVDDDAGGITAEGTALGHRYVMGNVNCYCPQCSKEHSEREGRDICVLDCDYDLDK